MPAPQPPLITVCPRCTYGFRDNGGPGSEFVCPRAECGHRWEAIGLTVRAVHGTERRRAMAELAVIAGGAPLRLVLQNGETIVGRDAGCTLRLDNLSVSRRHSSLAVTANEAVIEDLGSSCGTAVNGQLINSATRLYPGDQLILGGTTLQFDVRYEAAESAQRIADSTHLLRRGERAEVLFRGKAADTIPLDGGRITFGRAQDRDVVLSGPLISARHALLERRPDGDYLSDVQSASGTYVNGKPVIRARLVSGDRLQIGSHLFRYEGTRLVRAELPTAIGIRALSLTKTIGDATLLDNVSFQLAPGEFVGLLGPSGAGKTTLLDALNGLRPATSGWVELNSDSLYDEYARLRHHIGYVPQDDIIHRELTVEQALTYAAKLRLPRDLEAVELRRIVDETLDMLDLGQRRTVRISQLSGGQRKRVSVGVELLSRPGVLFLDEPTSGLDPGTETRVMKLFRRLADQGRTVVCTTHVMENVDLFHKVVILARGGKLAFFGPPQESKAFFGIDRFCDLYDRMEERTPDEWAEQFRQSAQYRQHIAPLVEGLPQVDHLRRTRRLSPAKGISPLHQWWTLVSRGIALQWADKTTLAVLLAQPVLITLLICLVCQDLPLICFLLVISALWFGCSSAAQQIVKERPIYRRERMVNLRLDAYLISKCAPLMALTTIQTTLMLGMAWLLEDRQGSFVGLYFALLLAAWNGVALGLLISAMAANGDKAMSVVPLTLIPQIILAGVLVPLPDMSRGVETLTVFVAARWANQACEAALLHGEPINADLLSNGQLRPLWNLYPAYDLETTAGRMDFLKNYDGETVQKRAAYWSACLVMLGYLLAASIVTCVVLKSQDTL